MKYFKYKLWEKINSSIEEERVKALEQWSENEKKYSSIFNSVKNRLPKMFIEIYLKNQGFHDWRLKKIDIIHSDYGKANPVEVHVIISQQNKSYKLVYKGIKKIVINYQKGYDDKRGFDDLGYNELLFIDDNILSHEILFASGATIRIYFTKISINKIRDKIK